MSRNLSIFTYLTSSQHFFFKRQGVGECGEFPTRSASEPTVSGLLNIARLGRLWATTSNLSDSVGMTPMKVVEKKKVKFQPAVRVVLIPSRSEYATADILIELWWEESDYSAFKASAVSELKSLMRSRNICNSKEAIRILYQPNDEDRDEICGEGLLNTEDSLLPPTPPPMIEDQLEQLPKPESACSCTESELELTKLSFLDARTDVDLTTLSFDKMPATRGDHEMKKIHPLAHMCQ